ncbi:hypothetical protein COO91_11028 (plasmid) [Nostoc flagelliforme CCNUN1]|uniref:Uncharacterized protein n=1 Tax=Nostoc flagelliforme CCNUN1 TaxID=2038116 RepID=A0A2K8TAU3_9NOSO|nr:hypothetical protein COO91_11028 [Nostoc flagelliforme CCNUN1]
MLYLAVLGWDHPTIRLNDYPRGAMRFCEVLKIRVLNHVFRGAIAAK